MQEHIEAQTGIIVGLTTRDNPIDSLRMPRLSGSTQSTPVNEYAELKRRVKQKGLMDQQPLYYTVKILYTLSLLALSLIFLIVVNHSILQLLNAVFIAFVSVQIAFIGHDIGHRQVFRTARLFEASSFITANLLIGWSGSWWVDRHNQHHGHPNEPDIDPDIDVPMLAFTEEEAQGKQGVFRFLVQYQAYLYLPWQILGWLSFLIFSVGFLLQKKAKHSLAEMFVIAIHYLLYFGLLFFCLDVWQAILFFIIHRALFSLYLGSVAAPNHKGMLVTDKDDPLDFFHQQVLSSRNVKSHPVTDFWCGGLNYQIEHHLFPTIPRNKLKEAQHVVKAFCQERSIPFHETGFLQSYREIFQHLHKVSASLRRVE